MLAVTLDARTWIARYAEALGVPAPSDEEVDALLGLAGIAAHASERTAAPLSCWLAAKAAVAADDALQTARLLADTPADTSAPAS
ncbi:MAG TPA: DUF6457 domain-containing protein [Acidimicrobiales bacterium]|nr:DUF6457 domain-containing protein [Acidimicrobiales bacterium]